MMVYRYDSASYAESDIMRSRGNSFDMLTDDQKIVEIAIRAAVCGGADIRGNSLYTWENEGLAKRLWRLSGKPYLYELEVEDSDIRHRGDLNFYTEALEAIREGNSPSEAIEKYWSGETSVAPWTEPRIELLASQARVRRRLS